MLETAHADGGRAASRPDTEGADENQSCDLPVSVIGRTVNIFSPSRDIAATGVNDSLALRR